MQKLLQHRVKDMSETGIQLRIFTPDAIEATPVTYMHQDDYYTFGFVDSGECHIHADFNEYRLSSGSIAFLQPGQVHSFISSSELSAFMLMIDSAFIPDGHKRILEEYALTSQTSDVTAGQHSQLKTLFDMTANIINGNNHTFTHSLTLHLSLSVIDIITANIATRLNSQNFNKRYIELTVTFKSLLRQHADIIHSPSGYAGLMNLSPAYLNEAVKAITGINVSQNIQNEIIVRAKRRLMYTGMSVKEIAHGLGFEDYAYFTRMFTKTAGCTPTDFRKRHK